VSGRALALAVLVAAGCARAPRSERPAPDAPFLDPRRPAEERAADLVRRMTVAEKVSWLRDSLAEHLSGQDLGALVDEAVRIRQRDGRV